MKKLLSFIIALAMTLTSIIGPIGTMTAQAEDVAIDTSAELQSYLTEKADPQYIPQKTEYTEAQSMLVKQSMYEASKLDELGAYSFDAIFDIKDKDGYESANAEAELMQLETYVGLYDFDKNNEYLVGFADTTRISYDGAAKAIDSELAYNNDLGEAISGYHYDKETGLVYIPKTAIKDAEKKASLQMQLMVPVANKKIETATLVSVKSEDKNIKSSTNVAQDVIFDPSMTVKIDGIGSVAQENIKIRLNGMKETLSSDSYEVKEDRIEIGAAPAALQSVEIDIAKGSVQQSLRNAFSTEAEASVSLGSWKWYRNDSGKELYWKDGSFIPKARYKKAEDGALKANAENSKAKADVSLSYNSNASRTHSLDKIGPFAGGDEDFYNEIERMVSEAGGGLLGLCDHITHAASTAKDDGRAVFKCLYLNEANKYMMIGVSTMHKDAQGSAIMMKVHYEPEEVKEAPEPESAVQAPRNITKAAATKSGAKSSGLTVVSRKDSQTGADAQGDGTLAGALFQFSYYEDENSLSTPTNTWVYKTNADGKVDLRDENLLVSGDTMYVNTSGIIILPSEGLIRVTEIQPPKGYMSIDTSVDIRMDDIASLSGPLAFTSSIIRGGAKVTTNSPGLDGAKYEIINKSDKAVYVDEALYDPDAVCATIEMSAEGVAKTSATALPYGKYEIRRVEAPSGYGEGWSKTFSIPASDGGMVKLTDNIAADNAKGSVLIKKYDAELDKSEAIGGKGHGEAGNTLSGITFSIVNAGDSAVVIDEESYEPNEEVATATSEWDEEEQAYVAKAELPFGKYSVTESEINDFYNASAEEYTFEIDSEETVSQDVNDNELIFHDQVRRGDFKFVKSSSRGKKLMVPFLLTNTASGETHVIITDENGVYDSASAAHSEDTNANDAILDTAKISSEDFKPNAGTWFGEGEDDSVSTANDDRGALPAGHYKLSEISFEGNMCYEMLEQEFDIGDEGLNVDLGDLINQPKMPQMTSTAIDAHTNTHVASVEGETTIIDSVKLVNLEPGMPYTLMSALIDKTTGEPVKKDGSSVTSFKPFTAEEMEQTIEVPFNMDAKEFAGKEVVVFEYLYFEGDLLLAHEDVDSEEQTIYFPKIETNLTSAQGHVAPIADSVSLTDEVKYQNLIPGEKYKVVGHLVNDKGEEIEGATDERTFTADAADSSVNMQYTIDSSKLDGTSVIAYESLYYNDVLLIKHENIKDRKQTVRFPELSTTAEDSQTGDQVGAQDNKTLTDVVAYKNIEPGVEYTLKGRVVSKETGENCSDEVTATFKPEAYSGTEELSFTIDADAPGDTFVVFESLYVGDALIAEHADPDDIEQSIYYGGISTNAVDENSGTHTGTIGKNVTIIDTVTYENLIPKKEYVLRGTLMNAETGEPIIVNDEPVQVERAFVPDESSGDVEAELSLDTTDLQGVTAVVFEDLLHNDVLIASHTDIGDRDQQIYFPQITTKAFDKTTEMSQLSEGETSIVDFVEYKNLMPGVEYTLKGKVIDKATGKVFKDKDGKELTKEVTFTAEEQKYETDGEKETEVPNIVEVTFDIDTTDLDGKTYVVFEDLCVGDKVVLKHNDIEDAAQTVHVPEVTTEAVDKSTKAHVGKYDEKAVVVDTIKYKNLIPGVRYTMTGSLIDKETGDVIKTKAKELDEISIGLEKGEYILAIEEEALKIFVKGEEGYISISDPSDVRESVDGTKFEAEEDGTYTFVKDGVSYKPAESTATGTVSFIPKAADGSVTVFFEVDNTALQGKTMVAFEQLYIGETRVASHEDKSDEDQSIHNPVITTTALGQETKTHEVGLGKQTIVDTVKIKNFVPEQTYTIKGSLVDKETKKVVSENEKTFTTDSLSGDVEVQFEATLQENHTYVVIEDLYVNDVKVAAHDNLNDKDQSVTAVKNPNGVKTGDMILPIVLVAGVGALLLILGIALKKKDKTKR